MNQNVVHKEKISHFLNILTPFLWMLILSVALLSPIIVKREFWTGLDTYFHMNTIYEDTMQIKNGHFSYFISMFGFERSGRIVNSLYGPIFSYLCGALLLACHSWINFEFTLFLITMMIGGIEMYSCGRALKLDRTISTLIGMFYIISRPVLITWVSNSEFTGLGATILLPLVVRVGIGIYQRRQIRILPLAIVMAVCLQIHLITSLVAVLVLIPITFCSFIRSSEKRQMVKRGLLSAVLSVCLSGNIFGALYDVFSSSHVIPTFPKFNLQTTAGNNTISFQNHSIVDLGYLYTLFLIVILILIIMQIRSIDWLDICFFVEDLFFLWISSNIFPWARLVKIFPRLASTLQFPARFVMIAFILTLLLLGRLVSVFNPQLKTVFSAVLLLIFILSLYPAVNTVMQKSANWQSPRVVNYWAKHHKYGGFRYRKRSRSIREAFRSPDITQGVNVIHKVTSDYLPAPQQLNIFTYYKFPLNKIYVRDFYNQRRYHKSTKDHELLMTWRNHGAAKVRIPLVKYPRTNVELNHRLIHPHESIIGTMDVKPRNGINRLKMNYQPGLLFRVMSLITILSWLIVLLDLINKNFKDKATFQKCFERFFNLSSSS